MIPRVIVRLVKACEKGAKAAAKKIRVWVSKEDTAGKVLEGVTELVVDAVKDRIDEVKVKIEPDLGKVNEEEALRNAMRSADGGDLDPFDYCVRPLHYTHIPELSPVAAVDEIKPLLRVQPPAAAVDEIKPQPPGEITSAAPEKNDESKLLLYCILGLFGAALGYAIYRALIWCLANL